jgi:hypothetical protein
LLFSLSRVPGPIFLQNVQVSGTTGPFPLFPIIGKKGDCYAANYTSLIAFFCFSLYPLCAVVILAEDIAEPCPVGYTGKVEGVFRKTLYAVMNTAVMFLTISS